MKLATYPFIKNLEPEVLKFLQDHIRPVSMPKGNLLFYQGDVCDNIFHLSEFVLFILLLFTKLYYCKYL